MERQKIAGKVKPLKNEKILLVDDEQGILDMLEILLQKEGFSIIKKAASGKEALSIVQTSEPDLIVLDVMLPDTDGFTLCSQIRQYTQAPVLFLTARSSDLDKLTGLGIGGDDYITKTAKGLPYRGFDQRFKSLVSDGLPKDPPIKNYRRYG